MNFTLRLDRRDDGRWIAEIVDLPGLLAVAETREDALRAGQALVLKTLAQRLEQEHIDLELPSVAFRVTGRVPTPTYLAVEPALR